MDTFNTHFEIKDAGIKTALLPVGSVEQHSRHLPLATDTIIAGEVSRRISEKMTEKGHPNYLLPPQAFATSLEHKGFTGTVTLRPPTLGLLIKDIVQSLYENDFKTVVILNFHGGNFILKPTIREINYDHPERKVIFYDGGAIPENEKKGLFETAGIHSGEAETSIMLAINKKYVRSERPDFTPEQPQSALDMLSLRNITPEGVWGTSSRASAQKGERYLALESEYAARQILAWIATFENDCSY